MKTTLSQSLVLCLLAIIPALAAGVLHPHRPAWTLGEGEVLLPTVRRWGSEVLWIDARPPEMYLSDRIPGALPLNLDMWDALFPAVRQASPGKRLVVYCADDSCDSSHAVIDRLQREAPNVRGVYILHGGFRAWNDAL